MLFRQFHARGDEKAISAWKLDLDEVHSIFEVHLFPSISQLLTSCLQTELAANTDITLSNIHHEFSATHTNVTQVCADGLNTYTIASSIHHGVANPNPIVSDGKVSSCNCY